MADSKKIAAAYQKALASLFKDTFDYYIEQEESYDHNFCNRFCRCNEFCPNAYTCNKPANIKKCFDPEECPKKYAECYLRRINNDY